jgi:threonine dehydratase
MRSNTVMTTADRLPIGPDDVAAAQRRLSGVANRTPVVTSRELDRRLGAQVFLKAESFQRGGAF